MNQGIQPLFLRILNLQCEFLTKTIKSFIRPRLLHRSRLKMSYPVSNTFKKTMSISKSFSWETDTFSGSSARKTNHVFLHFTMEKFINNVSFCMTDKKAGHFSWFCLTVRKNETSSCSPSPPSAILIWFDFDQSEEAKNRHFRPFSVFSQKWAQEVHERNSRQNR